MAERPYLSIGEVLALLLEEFPDVTISKIRFLESQGLIDPERTPSGYRKFYDVDVERLRVILREQRENFLPLRVIRDRLETGQLEDTGSGGIPRGIRNVVVIDDDAVDDPDHDPAPDSSPAIDTGSGRHPSARAKVPDAPPPPPAAAAAPVDRGRLTAAELCTRTGITQKQLLELESFGLLAKRGVGAASSFDDDDVRIVSAAARFLSRGIEARHLRGWKQSADREVSLFEQLVTPLLRQRNPEARQHADELLVELAAAGSELRSALLADALAAMFER